MKVTYDKGRTDRQFEVGNWDFLKLQSYEQISLMGKRRHKLSAKYYGPYQITECIGSMAYKLLLPEGSKIHPVIHVLLLKKQLKNNYVVEDELLELNNEYSEANVLSSLEDKADFEKGGMLRALPTGRPVL
ncbi:hypothetical protein Patl1_18698 [Pistacia atlantica]|uniref:Uncharacterized protein n=1 Tax=Pistacia atlantica TaxID=434234 RepID=A0ACC1C310_9ROSI|nr:hypothetical protein Patl1_18698 [Pistacia atlantica]